MLKLAKNIKNIARNVLINEAEAIRDLADQLDDKFEKCVGEILNLQGRVIITGVGKSAIIAQKIVATLNSTGTPALFMHAADAIHGDLGMVQSTDLAICISKSGNTEEIKVLVPLLKRKGVPIVGLVSNTSSYLAQQADYILDATISQEACPNNLAPTTSTTAHLAMGDALAVALLQSRNFTSEDFADLHPGGALGKRLYLKVSDVYPSNPLPKVSEDASIREVIVEISGKRLGATAVMDHEDGLLGIITDGDLRRMLEKGVSIEESKASEIMTVNPKSVAPDDYAVKALNIMQKNDITQLVVADGNRLLGFIHLHDLLKEGLV